MKIVLNRALAVVITILTVLGIAALSRLPFDADTDDRAVIRLAWRFPGELVNECRRPSEQELERLPVHMRREEVCEGRIVPYRLQLAIDDSLVIDEVVRAAGAREDRPLFVHREITVPPGTYHVSLTWRQERDRPEGSSRSAPLDGEATAEATFRLDGRDVALITYDPDHRHFETRVGCPSADTISRPPQPVTEPCPTR